MYNIDLQKERKEIVKRYRALLRAWDSNKGAKDTRLVRKAFEMASKAHSTMRRRTGEPYIYHPLEVARIVAGEIGLGETSIISALLHDVVEDNPDYTLDIIRENFGEKVTYIVGGLTKIKDGYERLESSAQVENIRKMLLTLSDDVRVILIKLADRLHNMRTLDAMPPSKQHNIAAETIYLYAPLAHRLGLYLIKSELEDLSLKYNEPEIYRTIAKKLKETEITRTRFINKFIFPIKQGLAGQGFKYTIDSRTKSVYSIYKKMQTKEIPFEEVYDLFAIRIIIDSPFELERINCWKVYTIITGEYSPKANRIRDWISVPKTNGYESLHVTVMSHTGEWVEVQIRTRRMHEIAERGYAAHWKYKQDITGGKTKEYRLDEWLNKVREILKSPDSDSLKFLDNIKLTLFSDEVFVFTPKGHLKTLPAGSTALDFAYLIHTEIGNHCIGVKVNRSLAPLNYKLRSGDQIEIITSQKSLPKEEWLQYAFTPRAIENIKDSLKVQRKDLAERGREKLDTMLADNTLRFTRAKILRLSDYLGFLNLSDMYYKVSQNEVSLDQLLRFNEVDNARKKEKKKKAPVEAPIQTDIKLRPLKLQNIEELNFSIANCCHPLPGDEIIAFAADGQKYVVHRTHCNEAIEIMSRFPKKVIHACWNVNPMSTFLGGIKINGYERRHMIADIIKVVSDDMRLNITMFHVETSGELFEAYIYLLVRDTIDISSTVEQLKKIEGITGASRMLRFHKPLA